MTEMFGKALFEAIMLCESSVSVDDINTAMDNRKRVIIQYKSDGRDQNTGPRLIEIYAYGLTKAGNPVIRAFQPYGDTTSQIPSWKLFRLDRITSWKMTGQTYQHPANMDYTGVDDFNPQGDGTMSTVYKIVSFNHDPLAKSSSTGPKKQSDLYQTDTERRMHSLQQQMKNKVTLDDLLGQKAKETASIDQKSGPKTKTDLNKSAQTQPQTPKEQHMTFGELTKKLQNGEDLFKTDTEQRMEKLRQQLNNPTKIDLSRIPRR